MTRRASLELPEPAGFPNCRSCAFLVNGPVRVCTRCAGETLTPVPSDHCEVCFQALSGDGRCVNRICNDPARAIESVEAIAVYVDPLRNLIFRMKQDPDLHWGRIFGRLVFGWLEDTVAPEDVDLIIPNPTFRDDGRQGHTEAVIAHASRENAWSNYPIDKPWDPALVKTRATAKSKSSSLAAKIQAAGEHASALHFRHGTGSVRGKNIIVYDDVLTSGAQLDAVARLLKSHGAASVRGLVLARVPWKY